MNWWLICYCCNPYIHKMYKWVLVVMLCVMECCNKKKYDYYKYSRWNGRIECRNMARGHPEYHQIRMRISLVQREKKLNRLLCISCFIRPMRMATSVDPFVQHKPLNPFRSLILQLNINNTLLFFPRYLNRQ